MTDNAHNEIIEMMRAKLKDIEDKGDILNDSGYWMKDFSGSYLSRDYDPKKGMAINPSSPHLIKLFSIIPLIFRSSERKKISSYGGKHIVEELIKERYVSNGEFILVMLCLGYKHKIFKDTQNITFYGSWTSTAEDKLKFLF